MSSTAWVSPSTRFSPMRRASSWRASRTVIRSTVTGRAPSVTIRPDKSSRLVTTTRHPGDPGSSGLTWSASAALSRTTRTRRPARKLRYRAAWASRLAGISGGRTPNASRNPRIASAGFMAHPSRVETPQVHIQLPIREPPADLVRPVNRQGGLPYSGGSRDHRDDHVRSSPARSCGSSASSWPISTSRPVKSGMRCGSWAGSGRCADLGRGRAGDLDGACREQVRIAGQDLLVEPLKWRSRL